MRLINSNRIFFFAVVHLGIPIQFFMQNEIANEQESREREREMFKGRA